jgi:hypothetical protein
LDLLDWLCEFLGLFDFTFLLLRLNFWLWANGIAFTFIRFWRFWWYWYWFEVSVELIDDFVDLEGVGHLPNICVSVGVRGRARIILAVGRRL